MILPRFVYSKIFLLLVLWRVSSVFIVQTAHVPDEYWQSLEVAHKLTFNYGYLTWEWRSAIRSYLYPFLISILYSIVKLLRVDNVLVLIYLPRIFHALLSAYAEYRFYLWTDSKVALFNICINWYWYYCATRTIINSFETCLTIIALTEYPWKDNPKKNSKFLWIIGLLCFARPTAAVFWLPLCLYHLSKSISLIKRYIVVGIVCLVVSTAIDSVGYGKFVLTPIEFLKINVLNNVSEQYGKMHPLWYLFSGLPVVLGLNYVFVPFVIYKIIKNYNQLHKSAIMIFVSIWSIAVFSLLAHKEFRFILPVLPMFIYAIDETLFKQKLNGSNKKLLIALLFISNALPALYFSIVHQQGALNVMKYLRNEIELNDPSKVDILFLTNCHATPYYSHLHQNISMRFLTCEPNLDRRQNYIDESDQFFKDPMNWLVENYLSQSTSHLPSHIVTYDSIAKSILPFLDNYRKLTKIIDTHFTQHGNFNEFAIYRLKTLS